MHAHHRPHASHIAALLAVAGLALPPSAALAQTVHNEVEPNDNKPQALANGPIVLAPGDTVVGNTTGATTTGSGAAASADYFLLKTVPAPLGVYRHRMLFSTTGTVGHATNLRGFGQWDSVINYYPGPGPTGANTEDATGNFSQTTATASTPARTITWYGFGREEQLYDRVTGGATTTGNYTLTYDRTAVTPTDLGTFAGGLVTISTAGMGHNSDTEIWVYDSTFHPVPGFNNDNVGISTTPGGANSVLTRDFTQGGDYYLAIAGQNLANNLPSPTDDKMRSVFVYEFPDFLTCSSNTANLNCAFQITDGSGANTQYPSGGAVSVTRAEPQEINWYKIALTAPVTGACCQPDGTCTTASAAGCSSTAGAFNAGTPCGSVTCAQPPAGACCLTDSTCTQVSSFACSAAGGVWRGAGAACGSPACPQTQQAFPGTVPGPAVFTSSTFFDVTAGATDLQVSAIDYYTAGGTHSNAAGPEGQLYVYPAGSYTTNTQSLSNTTPADGWSLNTAYTFPTNPGAFVPLHLTLTTPVTVTAGHTVGFYLATRTHGVRRAGFTNPADPSTFTGPDLSIYGQHCHNSVAANYPYWAVTLASQSTLIGRVYYSLTPPPPACYGNCDASTAAPVLNVADFTCFLQKFSAGDPYANCDNSTTAPVLNVADFTCFLQSFTAGCP